jgi:hypothetical protein
MACTLNANSLSWLTSCRVSSPNLSPLTALARIAFWQLTFAFVWRTAVAAFIPTEQYVHRLPLLRQKPLKGDAVWQ